MDEGTVKWGLIYLCTSVGILVSMDARMHALALASKNGSWRNRSLGHHLTYYSAAENRQNFTLVSLRRINELQCVLKITVDRLELLLLHRRAEHEQKKSPRGKQ